MPWTTPCCRVFCTSLLSCWVGITDAQWLPSGPDDLWIYRRVSRRVAVVEVDAVRFTSRATYSHDGKWYRPIPFTSVREDANGALVMLPISGEPAVFDFEGAYVDSSVEDSVLAFQRRVAERHDAQGSESGWAFGPWPSDVALRHYGDLRSFAYDDWVVSWQ